MELSPELAIILKKRALRDFIKRGAIGGLVYPLIWLSVGIGYGLQETHPNLLVGNAIFFIMITVLRVSSIFVPLKILNNHYKIIAQVFELSIITQGAHFGTLTTYVYYSQDLSSLVVPMLISAAGCVAGATALSINKRIRIFFPAFFLIPFILSLLFHLNKMNILIIFLILVFYIYFLLATNKIYNDYWSSITSNALLEQKTIELNKRIEEIKTLSGLLPICANCKKIRDDKGFWSQIEIYIRDHSEAEFTHGICPQCAKKLYPDINFDDD